MLSLDTRTHAFVLSLVHCTTKEAGKAQCMYIYACTAPNFWSETTTVTRGTRCLDVDETSLQNYIRWNTGLQCIKLGRKIEKSFASFLQKLHVSITKSTSWMFVKIQLNSQWTDKHISRSRGFWLSFKLTNLSSSSMKVNVKAGDLR